MFSSCQTGNSIFKAKIGRFAISFQAMGVNTWTNVKWKRSNQETILLFILVVLAANHLIIEAADGDQKNRCIVKENCGECIAESSDCAWCSKEDFSGARRCNFLENVRKHCKDDTIENPSNSMTKLTDMALSNKGTSEEDAIQMKPQEIRMKVRPNSPMTFQVQFRQAVDYPVDLYYVMDLSYTMKDDKEKLAELGDTLANKMSKITRDFRLGFGSFVDKKTAPYVSMHPIRLKNPCETGCAPPYGFQNNMPLSRKTREFARKVKESNISANLDGLEGGFDAIMQAIVCKEIGWRNKSRKLLVLSTDGGYHHAGDGKLAGIMLPNDEICHLDKDGYYTKTIEQDYPSLSQINRKIEDDKVTIIFAVTADQVSVYKELNKRLRGSTTGRLEGDSSNVVKLIQDQYNQITSSVELTDSLRGSGNIKISYQSKCLGQQKKKTNICNNLKQHSTVSFDVTIEVTNCPKDKADWQRSFEIYPVGLNEHLTIHLETICECGCEKPDREERNSPRCSDGNGTYECGICSCYEKRDGKECECDIGDQSTGDEGCLNVNDIYPCSNQGVCRCGKCSCFKRQNPLEKTYGRFCECNNFGCDKLCNGHGKCNCGECTCNNGWKGSDCGCSVSTDACMDSNGVLCGGHGTCVCGVCVCHNTEKRYLGKFCDDCPTCMEKCAAVRLCVDCYFSRLTKSKINTNCSSCDYSVTGVDQIEVKAKDNEKLCSFEDDKKCRYSFKYKIDEKNQPVVHVKKMKECPLPVNVMAIISGVTGSIVGAGLLLLLMWKLLTTVHDRRELAKFEKERKNATWDAGENPIYKQATSTFQNPVYGDN